MPFFGGGGGGTGAGDVTGPATNSADYIPQWDGANSKKLKNGIPISTFEPAKGSDDNYVTDAEKIVIGNTSGTNTGDKPLYDAIVASSGGDYTTVGAAYAAGKKNIFVREGTYTETGDIEIVDENVTIVGENKYSTKLVFPVSSDGIRLYSNNAYIKGLYLDTFTNSGEAPLVIGDGQTAGSPDLTKGNNNLIEDCYIRGRDVYGKFTVYVAGASYTTGGAITPWEAGQLQEGNIIRDCIIEGNQAGDVAVFGLQKEGQFVNNTVIGGRISDYMNRDCIIEGNTIKDSAGEGIFIAGPNIGGSTSNNVIISSTSAGIKTQNQLENPATYPTHYIGKKIKNNTIYNAGDIGVALEHCDKSDIDIFVNVCGNHGLYMQTSKQNNIDNINILNPNDDSNARGSGVYLVSNVKDNNFGNVQIEDNRVSQKMHSGFANREDTTCTGNIVENLVIKGKNNERTIWLQSNNWKLNNIYAEGGNYAGLRLDGASYCQIGNIELKNNTNDANNSYGEIWLQNSASNNNIDNIVTESTSSNKASYGVLIDSGCNNNKIGYHQNVGAVSGVYSDSGTSNNFLSGTNTGDETTATIKTKLGAASAGADGYLSSADWTTFNGKGDVSASGTQTLTNKTFDDELRLKQIATPANPSAGYNKLYFKNDDKLYKLTSGGTETEIGAGGGFAWGTSVSSGTGTGLAMTTADLGGDKPFLTMAHTASGTLTANTTTQASLTMSRTHTNASSVTDNYIGLNITRTNVVNNAGGTLLAQGALLSISATDTQTAGTLTPSYNLLDLSPSTLCTGSSIKITVPASIVSAPTNGHFNGVINDTQTVGSKIIVLSTGTANIANVGLFASDTVTKTTFGSGLITLQNTTAVTKGGTGLMNCFVNSSLAQNGIYLARDKDNAFAYSEVIKNLIAADAGFSGIGSYSVKDSWILYGFSASGTSGNIPQGISMDFSNRTGGTTGIAYNAYVKRDIAYNLYVASNGVNPATTGTAYVNYTLDNTQNAALTVQKIDTGTSAQGHTAYLANIVNASTSLIGFSAALSTTGTGTAFGATSSRLGGGEQLLNLAHTASGTLTACTVDKGTIASSRTHTAASSVTDNYNVLNFSRTNVNTNAGGTLLAQGSVVKIANVATPTDGTLTDTVIPLIVSQDTDSTGNISSFQMGTTEVIGISSKGIVLAENSSVIQDNSLSADGKYTGETINGTAGATLAFGDLCYLDPTDSKWELCDANSASGADGDSRGILGICVLAANENAATTMLLRGMVRADTAFPTLTVNAASYVSETAGDITETQPTTTNAVIRVVGFGFDANTLYFCPSSDFITHT